MFEIIRHVILIFLSLLQAKYLLDRSVFFSNKAIQWHIKTYIILFISFVFVNVVHSNF